MGTQRNGGGPPDLAAVEKRHRARLEKITDSDLLTDEGKVRRLNEAKAEFRAEYGQTRRDTIEAYDRAIEEERRKADPPVSDQALQRMARMAPIFLPRWERSYGNMIRDAEEFAKRGDEAGLRLVAQHAGIVDDAGPRTTMMQGVEAALYDLTPEAQKEARRQARSLEHERDRFVLASGLRQRGIIRALSNPLEAGAKPLRRGLLSRRRGLR